MDKLFNSTFEVSLRAILLLAALDNNGMTVDRLAAYDFMTVYSKYFGLSDMLLHGENEFGLSEIASRRKVMQTAIKELVLEGQVKVVRREDGFGYAIADSGRALANSLSTEYAVKYKQLVKITIQNYEATSEVKIMDMISAVSSKALRR